AFKKDGLLIITFDEGGISVTVNPTTHAIGFSGDASSCCDEQPGPNSANGAVFGTPSQGPGIIGPGGCLTGEVLISRFIKPGTVSTVPYNHYAQLKSIEDNFGLPLLGYAAQPDLQGWGGDVFTNPGG
ncbi:MAG: alkaline phosphatase family protein, partial [Bryobacteraceae bacterium]